MRYRAGPAALPQGRMNAAVGRVLAYQAVEQANRMQQATRDPASQGLPGRRREHPARLPAQLPIALDSGRAVFVYVDPGHDTATALRSWGAAHRGLWHALGKPRPVRRGRRRRAHLAGARASPDAGIREELARIERAIPSGRGPDPGGVRRPAGHHEA